MACANDQRPTCPDGQAWPRRFKRSHQLTSRSCWQRRKDRAQTITHILNQGLRAVTPNRWQALRTRTVHSTVGRKKEKKRKTKTHIPAADQRAPGSAMKETAEQDEDLSKERHQRNTHICQSRQMQSNFTGARWARRGKDQTRRMRSSAGMKIRRTGRKHKRLQPPARGKQ